MVYTQNWKHIEGTDSSEAVVETVKSAVPSVKRLVLEDENGNVRGFDTGTPFATSELRGNADVEQLHQVSEVHTNRFYIKVTDDNREFLKNKPEISTAYGIAAGSKRDMRFILLRKDSETEKELNDKKNAIEAAGKFSAQYGPKYIIDYVNPEFIELAVMNKDLLKDYYVFQDMNGKNVYVDKIYDPVKRIEKYRKICL